VPGLRREEVAVLAGVSTDWYNRLEKGHISGVSDEVLDAVARALQLDDAEREHLFNLARAAKPARTPHRRARSPIPASVQRVLDSMSGTAAFVRNGRLDILASNALGRALYSPCSTSPRTATTSRASTSSTRVPPTTTPITTGHWRPQPPTTRPHGPRRRTRHS
jgi:transcriptional regulator with XRE-family HTH domain